MNSATSKDRCPQVPGSAQLQPSGGFALGTLLAACEDQHRGVQPGGVGPSRALGNNDLDNEDFAGRGIAVRQFVRIRTATSSSQSWAIHFNR
jgi:hypothetical protein